jgi:hypothetical protein
VKVYLDASFIIPLFVSQEPLTARALATFWPQTPWRWAWM